MVVRMEETSDSVRADGGQVSCSGETPSILTQMGSGRRDSRVVCESFTNGKPGYKNHQHPRFCDGQKGFKRLGFAYSHSRNPLLACFTGKSALTSRVALQLSQKSESSGASQKSIFSLIPVESRKLQDAGVEPASPQLTCMGQVKCKYPRSSKTNDVVMADVPHLDLNEDAKAARLLRFFKAGEEAGKFTLSNHVEAKQSSLPSLFKQLLFSTVSAKSAVGCGLESGDDKCHENEADAFELEIDLSRFASCELQAKTPSFKDMRMQHAAMQKSFADSRTHFPQRPAFVGRDSSEDTSLQSGHQEVALPAAPIVNCDVDPVDATKRTSAEPCLWQRRCKDKPLRLQIKK